MLFCLCQKIVKSSKTWKFLIFYSWHFFFFSQRHFLTSPPLNQINDIKGQSKEDPTFISQTFTLTHTLCYPLPKQDPMRTGGLNSATNGRPGLSQVTWPGLAAGGSSSSEGLAGSITASPSSQQTFTLVL